MSQTKVRTQGLASYKKNQYINDSKEYIVMIISI